MKQAFKNNHYGLITLDYIVWREYWVRLNNNNHIY